MNYREKIRKAIECPQLTGTAYGEWGALRLDQKRLIKRLLDELDSADNFILHLNEERDIYRQRNEKAVEWCKCVINSKTTVGELPNGKRTDMGYCLDLAEPLLNILEGGDEE